MMAAPWRLGGPDHRQENSALEDALRRLHFAAKRKPTDEDRPPPSLFPMTAAARAAKKLRRDEARNRGRA